MKTRLFLVVLALAVLTAGSAWGIVEGKAVEYRAGETVLKGYLAQDNRFTGKRPAVLVVHEWWGHNDYARRRAEMMARQGYIALAVDMFGDGKTANHPADAGKFAAETMKNKAVVEARFTAAVDFIKAQPTVDPGKVAAIGYCFGGGVVLYMARQGADLKGVASFHGSLVTDSPARPGAVKARILVFTGEDDAMIPATQVKSFTAEMKKAGADFRVVTYPGAKHSFTNPEADNLARKFNLPLSYDYRADQDSWGQTLKFFTEIFK